MEIINYNLFLNEIISSQKHGYDCESISNLASLMIYDEIMVEDEENFYDIFRDVIFYFSSMDCYNDKNDFRQVIDAIITLSSERELNSFDIRYILYKEEISEIIKKYKNNIISESVLNQQLKKYFNNSSVESIKHNLNDRLEIKI